ncbi:MAG: hypothetical protein UMS36scaffold28_39 [Phage 59_13]|nr:MAG: hypothetical protein UMS36scaffold28_39 [Phage 59_13]
MNESLQTRAEAAPAERNPDLPPADPNRLDIPQHLNMSSDVMQVMFDQARRFPRDLIRVKDRALQELEIVPDLAARSYYSIPYNKGKQNETMVEGPSIKAAMTLCRNWGNAFNQGRLGDEDKSNVMCQGIFIDFETLVPTLRDVRVSKFYKPHGAQGVIPLNADRMYLATQAGISKAVRNAILASLPDWLVYSYFQRAKDIVVNPPASMGKPADSLEMRITKAKGFICTHFKVTAEEMEKYIADNLDSIEDDRSLLVHLQGLYTGLREGQYKADEIFRPGVKKEAPPMPQAVK